MRSYHSKEYKDHKHENITDYIRNYPKMNAAGIALHDIPAPEHIDFIDIYTDHTWDYVEVRIYFTGNPENYYESDGTTSSPMAQFLKETFTDVHDNIQHTRGHMDKETGEGHIYFNVEYVDETFEEYVENTVDPLAEKVAETFC